MGRQGSVSIAKLIGVQQRLRRLDSALDKLERERSVLVYELNEIDPLEFHHHRSLSPIPEPTRRVK